MKALVIDDERLARKELMNLLEEYPEVRVIGECNNADNAIKKIEVLKPDIIFLDIQMPGKDGFGLLEEISFVPQVVFTTAYDEFAIKAFEVNAFDYLLKPIEQSRLGETIEKLKATRQFEDEQMEEVQLGESSNVLGENDQVFVKDGEKCWFVKLSEVSAFESEGNYVRVYFKTFKPLILKSLNGLEQRLDQKVFFRANRKFIINLNWVDKIENWFNGGLRVSLKR